MTVIEKSPKDITKNEWTQILSLHKNTFNLENKTIKSLLEKRDSVIIIYYKDNIVATVGIQTIVFNSTACLYFGNVIIQKKLRKSGILTRVILQQTLKFIIQYWRHDKYIAAFATTHIVYNYIMRFKHAWPQKARMTPNAVQNAMNRFSNCYTSDMIQKKGKDILLLNLYHNVTHEPKKLYEKVEDAKAGDFYDYNPFASQGNQLLCFAKINPRNILTLLKLNLFTTKKLFESTLKKVADRLIDQQEMGLKSFILVAGLILGLAAFVF